MSSSERHRNDIYANVDRDGGPGDGVPPPIPAATVVLLRDRPEDVEILMLRRNPRGAFGGMWVFPGGRIDAEDYAGGSDVDAAARTAAARETREEAGLEVRPDMFVEFAHWTPPPMTPKRFATWFFAADAGDHAPVAIDGGEILDHAWLRPAEALSRHAAGEVDLAPPTWVTLHYASAHRTVADVLAAFAARPRRVYETRIATRADGVRVAMWHGDAGYDALEADRPGPRHRLVMAPGGFTFENDVD